LPPSISRLGHVARSIKRRWDKLESKDKFLICPGHGKCGTTAVHDLLASAPRFCVPEETKELMYFNTHRRGELGLADYLSNFSTNRPEHGRRVIFEASPAYLTGGSVPWKADVLRLIRAILPRPRLLLCFRNPVYRAFSHYIEELNALPGVAFVHAGEGSGEPPKKGLFSQSFREALETSSVVGTDYSVNLDVVLAQFSIRDLFFYVLERDARDPAAFVRNLYAFLEEDEEEFESPPRLPSPGMPFYVYGGRGGARYEQDDGSVDIPARCLVIMRRSGCEAAMNVTELQAQAAFETETCWTSGLSAAEACELWERRFAPIMARCAELLRSHGADSKMLLPDYGQPAWKDTEVRRAPVDLANLRRVIERATTAT
jgi:hypothetical protein